MLCFFAFLPHNQQLETQLRASEELLQAAAQCNLDMAKDSCTGEHCPIFNLCLSIGDFLGEWD